MFLYKNYKLEFTFCLKGVAGVRNGLLTLLLSLYSAFLQADMVEVTPLSFGRFVVAGNSTISTIVIRFDGRKPLYTNQIYPLEFGTNGEYFLSNFPSFTPLNITIISTNNLTTSGPTEEFSVADFTHNDVTTDANGQATLFVGATLSTSGSGNPYVDATYDAPYIINIDF
ncbi:hypothetical protein [Halioxenophilus sp. WMMB6]|uniref:hypothetical protein n=1 Tax=Halioxenophilus sp. WMMB6 TaxID=3073815 RepID=UPI00295F45DC|nr:hypothetical protein [Halioxenophilus sp. WMMB6]